MSHTLVQNFYNKLIETAQSRTVFDSLDATVLHHIKPKCLGGDDSPENVCFLTHQEHERAHILLHLLHPDNEPLKKAVRVVQHSPVRKIDEDNEDNREFIKKCLEIMS